MDPYIDPDALDLAHPLTAGKVDNLRRADKAYADRREAVDALPSKLTLQTTDACNLDCPHCQIPRAQKSPRMGREVLDAVIRELFPTLIELHPTNLGEPFAWPLFSELCSAMAQHGVLLDLTTNGTLLDEARVEWIAPIAREVKISFDGARPETFERLRRGARFDAVCKNVRRLVARLSQVRCRRPVVSLQMTIMRSNVPELPALVALARELGVTYVRAYHLFSFSEEMDREAIVGEPELWQPFIDAAADVGARLGIGLQLAEPAAKGEASAPLREIACHLPWHETWIDLDGAVLPCHSHGGDLAGNVLHAPFPLIWNGPLYRRIRAGFAADRPTWHCNGCGMCYRRANRTAAVPYDTESFRRRAARSPESPSLVRWSGRMRPFELTKRR